jgi:hypothetical protein
MDLTNALLLLFRAQPFTFSLLGVACVYLYIQRRNRRTRRQLTAHMPADQETIEGCLRKWREFRPDMMPRIYADLVVIRQTEDVVRVGHLDWLLDKLIGKVPCEAPPPRINAPGG